MILIVFGVAYTNVQHGAVRAEDFGQQSLLFSFVSDSFEPSVEEVVVSDEEFVQTVENYYGDTAITGSLDIDTHSPDDSYVTTTVGGALYSPPTSGSADSVAPRLDIETYAVSEGDTLSSISERFGLSLNTLLWANGLSFRSTLRIGQSLTILPVDGVVHKVKKGDTVAKIARTYGGDAGGIVSFNRLASANDLTVGESLVVPGGKVVAVAPARSLAPVRNLISPPAGRALPAGSGKWVWPSDMRYITQYFGWRHTGIDVDCSGNGPRSHSVNSNYAAADGVVIYSGWRKGYGNTVEVDHGNGITTRYAHNEKNYVGTGTVVTAGTPLALCGTTGRSTGTHLHFEVIVGGRFKNPLEYLR